MQVAKTTAMETATQPKIIAGNAAGGPELGLPVSLKPRLIEKDDCRRFRRSAAELMSADLMTGILA